MSGDDSTALDRSFEDQLEAMYDRYRRQSLANDLEALAVKMEDTILQQELAGAFFHSSISIDDEAKDAVKQLEGSLRAENYDTAETELPEIRDKIDDQVTRVNNEIQKHRLTRLDTVRAMRRLNDRLNRVDETKLKALEQLLDNWDWEPHVKVDTAKSVEQRRSEARTYGEEMARIFEQLQDKLFEPYRETDLWPIVESLLDDTRLIYATLSEEERRQLAESGLEEYVELSLS